VGAVALTALGARVLGVSAALALALAGAVALLAVGDAQFTVTARTSQPICAGTQPVVCVDPEYAHWLPRAVAVAGPLARALGHLARTTPPTRIEQATASTPAGRPSPDGSYRIAVPAGHDIDPMNVALDLLGDAAGCPAGRADPSAVTFDARVHIAAFLVRTQFPQSAPPEAPGTSLDAAGARALLSSMPGPC
jgi:hypothetical protein